MTIGLINFHLVLDSTEQDLSHWEQVLHVTHCLIIYRQVSNISRTLVGNKIGDHSDVVGASPVGAAPTTSLFST